MVRRDVEYIVHISFAGRRGDSSVKSTANKSIVKVQSVINVRKRERILGFLSGL